MPTDRVPFYTDEQFTSQDLVTLQRNAERALEELAAFRERSYATREAGLPVGTGTQPTGAVLGGFDVQTAGTLLQVMAGALVTTQVPSPDNVNPAGAYIAVNVETVDVPLPSPVGDAWYIVAGRPVLVNAAAVPRRVWDRPGKKWQDPTPSLVKLQTSEMVFDVVACPDPSKLAATLPANSVPLWGVFRPGGGGAINQNTHLVDLRPFRAASQSEALIARVVLQNSWIYQPSDGLRLAVHVRLDQVELMAHTTSAGFDPLLVKDPSVAAPAANEWWYLYLAKYAAFGALSVPRHAQLGVTGLIQQGLLIFSKTPPRPPSDPYARYPSANITPPLPYSTAPQTYALCVLALRRNAANTDWLPCQCDDGHVTMMGRVFAPSSTDSVTDFSFDHEGPLGARSVVLEIQSSAGAGILELLLPDLSVVLHRREDVVSGSLDVDLPVVALGNSTTVRLQASASGTWRHRMRGYRL